MLIPPFTPSGRPIPRSVPFRSLHEIASLVARGHLVHPTGGGVVLFRRDDIVQVPIRDLPPVPFGLIWCTAHENARIRALAATARSIGRSIGRSRTRARAISAEEALPDHQPGCGRGYGYHTRPRR
jgi:hypothetical protein